MQLIVDDIVKKVSISLFESLGKGNHIAKRIFLRTSKIQDGSQNGLSGGEEFKLLVQSLYDTHVYIFLVAEGKYEVRNSA